MASTAEKHANPSETTVEDGAIERVAQANQTEDLKKIYVPTLIMYGDDDQIVPIGASARYSVELVKVYQGAPHGLCTTHKDRVNVDLLSFFKG